MSSAPSIWFETWYGTTKEKRGGGEGRKEHKLIVIIGQEYLKNVTGVDTEEIEEIMKLPVLDLRDLADVSYKDIVGHLQVIPSLPFLPSPSSSPPTLPSPALPSSSLLSYPLIYKQSDASWNVCDHQRRTNHSTYGTNGRRVEDRDTDG